jgi:hypothetical protein
VTDAPAYERVVAIASCGSRWEADLKRSVLDAEGYRVALVTDDAGGLHPELAYLACVYRLMVPETEAESARELLDAIEADSTQVEGSVERYRASRGWWVAIAVLVTAVVTYRIWFLAASG